VDHFKIEEDNIETMFDKRPGKTTFQNIHMSSKKGKESSQLLAKEITYFVNNKTDQADFLESLASCMQSNDRPVPATLKVYKPELPRIFMKADNDDLPSNWVPPTQRKRRLLKFSHVKGAKVYGNLFHTYSDPATGQQFFLYTENKVMEAPAPELPEPAVPVDDQNVDTLAAAIGLHHSEPLDGVTIQTELPSIICRKIFPEISCSGLQKRFCSTSVGAKNFDVHIADSILMRLKLERRKVKKEVFSEELTGSPSNDKKEEVGTTSKDDRKTPVLPSPKKKKSRRKKK